MQMYALAQFILSNSSLLSAIKIFWNSLCCNKVSCSDSCPLHMLVKREVVMNSLSRPSLSLQEQLCRREKKLGGGLLGSVRKKEVGKKKGGKGPKEEEGAGDGFGEVGG